jgi:hypothetical protein
LTACGSHASCGSPSGGRIVLVGVLLAGFAAVRDADAPRSG